MNNKLVLLLATFLFTGAQFAKADMVEFKDETLAYAGSWALVGVTDHFQHTEKQTDFNLLVPVLKYGAVTMNSGFIFNDGLEEFHLQFPIATQLLKGMTFTPNVFRNFEAEEWGVGISALVKIR